MVGGARLGRQQRPLRAGIVLLALLECATGFLSAGGPIRPSGRSASLAVCKGRGFVRLGGRVHLVQLVGRRLEIEPSDLAVEAGALDKLVLISRA